MEDCISAIKVARQCDAMPILGSHVSLGKLVELGKQYKQFYFWLDADKFKESMKQAQALSLLGPNVRVIYTELDPKEYDDVAIQKRLE